MDVMKKRYWRASDARAALEKWRSSGQSMRAFCRERGVNPRRLGRWRGQLSVGTEGPRLVELVVPRHPSPGFVVHVGEVHVEVPVGFDADELRRLVDALC